MIIKLLKIISSLFILELLNIGNNSDDICINIININFDINDIIMDFIKKCNDKITYEDEICLLIDENDISFIPGYEFEYICK